MQIVHLYPIDDRRKRRSSVMQSLYPHSVFGINGAERRDFSDTLAEDIEPTQYPKSMNPEELDIDGDVFQRQLIAGW